MLKEVPEEEYGSLKWLAAFEKVGVHALRASKTQIWAWNQEKDSTEVSMILIEL